MTGNVALRLEPAVRPVVEGLGYVLWRIDWNSSRRVLQVMAERRDGVPMTVDDCAEISRAVSPALDVHEALRGEYRLEVSSPGIDRPLVTADHFARYVGREAKVEMQEPHDGRKRFRGVIARVNGEDIVLDVEGSELTLPLGGLKKARLIPTEADYMPGFDVEE